MPIATIISQTAAREFPRRTIVEYSDTTGVDANSSSSELIHLQIPGMKDDSGTMDLSGHSKIMQLTQVSISCDSTNYDFVMLNVNDITKLNTIDEEYRLEGINLDESDVDFKEDTLENNDNTRINKLYGYIVNNDAGNPTGTIRLRLHFNLFD